MACRDKLHETLKGINSQFSQGPNKNKNYSHFKHEDNYQ